MESGATVFSLIVIAVFFLAMVVAMVLPICALAFWIWMIVDCCTKEPAEDKDKLTWVLVVVLTNWIGALIYYVVRRPKRIAQYGQ